MHRAKNFHFLGGLSFFKKNAVRDGNETVRKESLEIYAFFSRQTGGGLRMSFMPRGVGEEGGEGDIRGMGDGGVGFLKRNGVEEEREMGFFFFFNYLILSKTFKKKKGSSIFRISLFVLVAMLEIHTIFSTHRRKTKLPTSYHATCNSISFRTLPSVPIGHLPLTYLRSPISRIIHHFLRPVKMSKTPLFSLPFFPPPPLPPPLPPS